MPHIDEHRNGQVEVDAACIGYRGGRPNLFVIEAKTDEGYRTLAKHKLIYPVLALAQTVRHDLPIIPVYLKMKATTDHVTYHIVECRCPDPRKETVAIDQLQAVSHQHWQLRLPT